MLHDLAVLEEQQGRNRSNSVLRGDAGLLVDIELSHRSLPVEFGSQLFDGMWLPRTPTNKRAIPLLEKNFIKLLLPFFGAVLVKTYS